MSQFRLIKPSSVFKFLLIFNSILLLGFNASSQIFAPEGVNITGSFIGFQNPPVDHLAFANENQVPGGKFKLITTGIRRWQTTFYCADTTLVPSADVPQGDFAFLFTSGPSTNAFGNKWAGVNVVMNTLQNYTFGASADNAISLVNNNFYTVNFEDAGYTNTRSIFMVTSAAPVTIDSVFQLPAGGLIAPNIPVVVKGLLSAAPTSEERFYLRYSTDAFATSNTLQMSVVGDSIIGTIPGLTNGNTIQYYVFSSTLPTAPSVAHDLYTLNFKNNNGLNFIYNVVAAPILNVNLGPDATICPGATLTLTTDETYDSYLWSTGQTSETINITQPGQYFVAVTQGAQIDRDTINVAGISVPSFSLGNDTSVCGLGGFELQSGIQVAPDGDSLTITYDATLGQSGLVGATKVYFHSSFEYAPFGGPVTPFIGNWGQDDGVGEMTSIGNNKWRITIQPQTYYGYNSGLYINGLFMVFRNADGTQTGKDNNGNDIFLGLSGPSPVSAFAGVTATRDESIYTDIVWNTEETSSSIIIENSGTYSATVTIAGGCEISDTIQVTLLPAPALDLPSNISTCVLPVNNVIDAGAGFASYNWSTGATTQTIVADSAGTYSVEVTAANGCKAEDSTVVVVGTPFTFSLGNDSTICGAGPLVISPNVGLFFNGDSLTIRYDATKGIGDLENAEKVYMHSGISVSANGPWTYVAGNWGQDDGWGEMTEVLPNIWEITINPTSHYNLPPAMSYAGIWMVFRNADGTVTGKDNAGQDIYLNTSISPAFTSTFDGITNTYTPGPYQSIIWSTGATSQSITISTSGTYSATISNGSCTATDSITVSFLPSPALTVSNDTSFCGAIQNLPIAASAGFDEYLWSNGATTASIFVNAPGTYEVTASMNNGCSFTDSVVVRNNVLASSVALGPDRTICGTQVIEIGPSVSVTSAGDSITIVYDATKGIGDLEGANKVYFHSTYELVPFGGPVTPWVGNWGLDDGLGEMTALGNDKWSITFNPYSYYNIALGTSLNGLFMVFRNANGTLTGKDDTNNDIFLNLSVNTPTSAFDGITAMADISPFEGILWSNGATTQTIAVNTPGTYSMIVYGAEGCNVYDTIQVNSSPSPFVNLGPNRFICPGTPSIILNAGAGFSSYAWSTGDSTQTLTVSDAGVYIIAVTNFAGCVGTDQLTVILPGAANAQFTAVEGNGLQVTFTNTSTGTDTYAWDFDGNGTTDNSSANATVTFTYPSVGTYSPRLIATGLCGTDTFTLQVSVIGLSTGEEITQSSWAIYPNPANEVLNMCLPQAFIGTSIIEMYNEMGALVRIISTNDKIQVINVSEFSSGIYFVRLTNGNTVYTKRFVKQ